MAATAFDLQRSAGNPEFDQRLRELRERWGDQWSFDIVSHERTHSGSGAGVKVTGELRANGSTVREAGTANGGQSLGSQLQQASNDSLLRCATTLLARESSTGAPAPSSAVEARPSARSAPPAAPAPRSDSSSENGILTRAPSQPGAKPVPPTRQYHTPGTPKFRDAAPDSVRDARPPPAQQAQYPAENLDPVTLRVIGGAFNAIAHEMAHVLYRMSYSSIIRESEDLGCGIFDREGNEFCESESTPMHIGSLPWYIRGILERLDGDIHDGDVIIHNHPYYGASHTPDLAVLVPIFHAGELLGFAGCTAHLLDLGGAAPGINVDVIDVFAEAKLFNAVKLYDRGRRNEEMWRMITDNVRTPDMDTSDIEAMIASVELGKERFGKLVDKYGVGTTMGAAYYWLDYSERMLRDEIEKLPDGEYYADGWLDDDGRNRDEPLKVAVTVRVKGRDIEIDLTGSAPEVDTGYNVPFEGSLIVACNYIVRTLLLDEATTEDFVPQNEGMFRPVRVVAPKGTIFNPNFPRACFSRFCQVQRVLDCVLQALAPVVPEKVTGGNSAALYFISYSGFIEATQQYWMYLEVNEGSYGGRATKDGCDSVDNLMANTRNNPIEELDMHYPLRNQCYELRPEPPAAGKWRGGLGIVRENLFLEPGFISCEADRHLEAPVGIFGGEPGRVGALVKNPGKPNEERWPSKITGYRMEAGDVMRIVVPSAGGYGNPRERDPALVLDDWLDDYITLDIARDTYGVVIDGEAEQVDVAATDRLRAA